MFNPRSMRLGIGVFGVVLCSSAQAQGEPSLQQAQAECQSIAQQQQGSTANAYHQAYASCMAARGFPGQ